VRVDSTTARPAARVVAGVRTIAIVTIRGHSLSPAAARLVALCEQMIPPDRRPPADGR
jgi:hypothetical protein